MSRLFSRSVPLTGCFSAHPAEGIYSQQRVIDPDSKGKSSAARRWRRMSASAKLELESQGTFFNPPQASKESTKPAPTAEDASSLCPVIESPIDPNLTADQAEALRSIEAACKPGESYLLTGHAGSGKTYLMQRLTINMKAKSRRVILTAPTHKAVAVLARKLAEAEITGVPCRTIHSVLSLTPKPNTDRMEFARDRDAEPILADVVVVDECSMVSFGPLPPYQAASSRCLRVVRGRSCSVAAGRRSRKRDIRD